MTVRGADMSFLRLLFTGNWDIAPTLGGWTPGLRAIVDGRVLACGCLVGDYITKHGRMISIIDHAAPGCSEERHGLNHVIDRSDQSTPSDHGCILTSSIEMGVAQDVSRSE